MPPKMFQILRPSPSPCRLSSQYCAHLRLHPAQWCLQLVNRSSTSQECLLRQPKSTSLYRPPAMQAPARCCFPKEKTKLLSLAHGTAMRVKRARQAKLLQLLPPLTSPTRTRPHKLPRYCLKEPTCGGHTMRRHLPPTRGLAPPRTHLLR